MKLRALLTILPSLLASPAGAQQTLILNSAFTAPLTSEQHNGVLDKVYQQLAERMGITIRIENLSASERGLRNADNGLVDGDVGRVAGIEKQYPNLISVPVPVMRYEMVVFSRSVDFNVSSPESIKPYNVGVVRGWKVLEQAAFGAYSVTPVETAEQMFTMLSKGRIDIALLEKLEGLQIINSMNIKDIRVLKPDLFEGHFYLYLNKKHAALVLRFESELRKMQREGLLLHIYEDVLKRYEKDRAR